jgi:hypothetical protein
VGATIGDLFSLPSEKTINTQIPRWTGQSFRKYLHDLCFLERKDGPALESPDTETAAAEETTIQLDPWIPQNLY